MELHECYLPAIFHYRLLRTWSNFRECRVENVSLCIMYCCQIFFKCYIGEGQNFYRGYDEYPCYLAPCENSSAIHDTLYINSAKSSKMTQSKRQISGWWLHHGTRYRRSFQVWWFVVSMVISGHYFMSKFLK